MGGVGFWQSQKWSIGGAWEQVPGGFPPLFKISFFRELGGGGGFRPLAGRPPSPLLVSRQLKCSSQIRFSCIPLAIAGRKQQRQIGLQTTGIPLCLEAHFWLWRCRPGLAQETGRHTYREKNRPEKTGRGMTKKRTGLFFSHT